MANIQHEDAPIGCIHIIHNWEYADATARLAASGFVAADVGKVAKQTDTATWWVLASIGPIVWKDITGTGAGSSGSLEVLVQTFTYNDSSPVDFGTLAAGDMVINSEVEITTIFDDVAAIVTLGLSTATGSILNSGEVDPLNVGTYQDTANHDISGADAARLQIIPGTSTQGAGRAIVTIRRA